MNSESGTFFETQCSLLRWIMPSKSAVMEQVC